MRKFKILIKYVLYYSINFIIKILAFLLLKRRGGDIPHGRIKRILIYGTTGIGNMVLLTPTIKALRHHFPQAQIILLFFNQKGASEVLMGSNLIDGTIVCNVHNIMPLIKLLQKIKKWKPDLIIARYNNNNILNALVTVAAASTYRIGHVPEAPHKRSFNHLYNYPVKMNINEHEMDTYLSLLQPLGIFAKDRKTVFHTNNEDDIVAEEFLKKNGVQNNAFITMQLGTSYLQHWKRWDTKNSSKLIECLLAQNINIVMVGSPEEEAMTRKALSSLTVNPVFATGRLTLKQSAAVIKRSRLLICHDSGLMHIAAAFEIPVVAIFGPTSPLRNGPQGFGHTIIRKDLPCSPCYPSGKKLNVKNCKSKICLESVEVQDVLEAVIKKLQPAYPLRQKGNSPEDQNSYLLA